MRSLIALIICQQVMLSHQQQHFPPHHKLPPHFGHGQPQSHHQQMPEIHAAHLSPGQAPEQDHNAMQGQGQQNMHNFNNMMNHPPPMETDEYPPMEMDEHPQRGMGGHHPMDTGGHPPIGMGGRPPMGMGGHHPMDMRGHPSKGMGGHHPMDMGGHPSKGMGGHHPMDMHPPKGMGGHQYQYQPGDDIPFGPDVETDLSPELQERVLEKVNDLVPEIIDAIVEHEEFVDIVETQHNAGALPPFLDPSNHYRVFFISLLSLLILLLYS